MIIPILFAALLSICEADLDLFEIEEDLNSCDNSTFGCCANSSLPAHGPRQEGCCLQDPSGCCPDHVRVHDGFCSCHDAPLGCCPDGVTSRWSEEEDGCGCQSSRFGCCQDQYTAAEGTGISNHDDDVNDDIQDLDMRDAPAGPRPMAAAQTASPRPEVTGERDVRDARSWRLDAVLTS